MKVLGAGAALVSALLGGCAILGGGDSQTDAEYYSPSLRQIADNVWIHTTWFDVPTYGPVLSHGMVVKTDAGTLLIDTAWTDEDTYRLMGLIEEVTGAAPAVTIATHAHNDKMGGMAAANNHTSTAAFVQTNEDAPARGLTPALNTILESSINGPLTMQINADDGRLIAQGGVELFYPGPGHTRDNIVAYYAPAKILFGGCLIRPGESKGLGNAADADVANWAGAVRAVAERFPDAEIIVPSHGDIGGRELLDHTIAIAEAAANEG